MKGKTLLLAAFFLGSFLCSGQDHKVFDALLKKHVSPSGIVNYAGFLKDKELLDAYIVSLQKKVPQQTWTSNQKLAYWINNYNANTILLILKHADKKIKSIKDIGSKIKIPFVNTPWDIKFIKVGEEIYDLNHIEHQIIRKQFSEPKIHFALVCAAVSCPKLRNEAYLPELLYDQLQDQAKDFINDSTKNSFSAKSAELSEIFNWYGSDFKSPNILDYISKYAKASINTASKIGYKKYNWALNGTL
jgi:hypothetical protein